MFEKKKCPRCNNNIEKKYDFCPSCALPLKKPENLGMLGKNDLTPNQNEFRLPGGLGIIFNSLLKNLDKQFQNMANEMSREIGNQEINPNKKQNPKNKGISISITTANNRPPEIKVNSFGKTTNQKTTQIEEPKKYLQSKAFNLKNQKKFSTLKRAEPKTNIRRLSDKIIYEISMPGIKTIEDISIVKLENSIEVKGISKTKAYDKIIPISLPISDLEITKGKLILELESA